MSMEAERLAYAFAAIVAFALVLVVTGRARRTSGAFGAQIYVMLAIALTIAIVFLFAA